MTRKAGKAPRWKSGVEMDDSYHLQFSGVIQREDAELILPLLRKALDNRPADTGGVLRCHLRPAVPNDQPANDRNGIIMSIDEFLDPIVSKE